MKATWRRILTEYKVSKKKNAGTIPKDVFPRLHEKLMLELPNQSDNIKAGSKTVATPVVNRLPQESNEAVNNSVSEQEAEASAPRAEPEAEERASVMGAEASVSDDDEVGLSSEDGWTPATERNIFNSFQ
ncbi:hypothetical protein RRG08_025405 [Elysia crispata]|uniref:Uncharacterized protein n=1 Tax=Elysia crispata TaxID=231223 RepID=A0AAE0Z8S9_9GAST|nr:hypothetical protein RRG08_025405 [Elysia crispata]